MATANVTGGSTLSNVISLAQLLGGGGNQTVTTTKNVSQDAINAAIRKQLGSTQGLAAITGGEKTAGLYNSTVSQQLVNDLLSRTAGEAAAASGSTTQTTSGGGLTAQTGLTGLGLLALTDDSFRKTAKEGISSLADVVSGLGTSSAVPEIGNTMWAGSGLAEVTASELEDYFRSDGSVAFDVWDWASSFWR